MSEIIFADRIRNVSYSNGVLRISLGRQNGDDSLEDAGVLIMPITQAGNFVNALGRSLKELEAKVREAQTQQQENVPAETAEDDSGQSGDFDFGRQE